MKASKRQIGYLVSLARKVGEHLEFDDFIGEHDEVLITSQEANQQIKEYRKALNWEDDPTEKMRLKIISMARTIGWEAAQRADMDRINNWCEKYGQYKKPLNDHTYNELTNLVSQFQHGPFKSELERV
ncbi:MAG: hypothetical protein CMJ19_02815 [Phycisphaeraceae bacterium]|nr:hypothetical protein [Phycisphaeraceae bacterium]